MIINDYRVFNVHEWNQPKHTRAVARIKSLCMHLASRIIGVSIVYSTVCSGADQRKHQSSATLAFARRIHWSPVYSPHKGPMTRKKASIWWRHHDANKYVSTYNHTQKHICCLIYIVYWKGEVISNRRQFVFLLCLSHIQPWAPYDFYHPYDFLSTRPSEAPVEILRRCCSHGHIRFTGPVQLNTAAYLWFCWIIRRTPRVPRAMPVRTSCGPHTGIFNVFHILRDPYGARVRPSRVPCGAFTDT